MISFKCLSQQALRQIKQLTAVRTKDVFTIDAELKEAAWQQAAKATDFVLWRPNFGKIEPYNNRTEIYFLYDDNAFYIAGYCHEASVDSISKELVGRDVVGVNDFVGVMFDTYNDKINGFGYYVTPLGEQFDAKYSANGEDGSWNSVYETQSKIVKDGWVFEMKIPYAAMRFVAKPNQTWGINITRRRSKSAEQYMWNPVDQNVGGTFFAQNGLLTNINNIKPPVRLSLSPYFSINSNHYPYNNPNQKNLTTTINGGMDVKYGINQAFTLDMTLVPDFSQVQSDNQILNLGPFEVKYNEFRTFFTEGTELFSKGNMFYSRRIGGYPINGHLAYRNSNDSVIINPNETKLINASKISGRTQKGLGIGFLNAVTKAQHATVLDKTKDETKEIETSPLVNYSVLVLDQTLKNNSSISFVNTSVVRNGADYDAYVSAFLWDFYDKKNVWNFNGKFGVSNLIGYDANGKSYVGHTHQYNIQKVGGRLNFNFWQELSSAKYQQNDLGYATNNNYLDNGFWMGYRWLTPTKLYKRMNFNFDSWYSARLKPFDYQSTGFNSNLNALLHNLWNVGFSVWFNLKSNDFYEARTNGYVFHRPLNHGFGFNINNNEANKHYVELKWYFAHRPAIKGFGHEMFLTTQYRFNKKLTVTLKNHLDITNNGTGYALYDTIYKTPVVALRQGATIENTLNIKYNFTNKIGLNFRTRHYWSKLHNEHYQQLFSNGSTKDISTLQNADANINFFNVDMTFNWQFALGSFITFNWKDISRFTEMQSNYFSNFSSTLSQPQNNSFSIKIIYFLDYLSLRRRN